MPADLGVARVQHGAVIEPPDTAFRTSALTAAIMRAGRTLPAPRSAPRVLIVSNRLPWTAERQGNAMRLRRSSGGLATGLSGVHARSGGLWIGWSGVAGVTNDDAKDAGDVAQQLKAAGAVPVRLLHEEVAGFYRGFSNEVLWPVLHGFASRGDASDWATYRTVNERYAAAIATHMCPGDRVWIHDYHLMLVPAYLRRIRPDARIGFFLHTPFPSPEAFALLPQRAELLRGVLGADAIGFHTRDYVTSFREALTGELGVPTSPDHVMRGDRRVSLLACPIGIDVAGFEALAASRDVVDRVALLRTQDDGPVFLGIDRLDYTKGIPQRLLAFERLLAERPDLCARARLIQVAVPSREDAAGYGEVRAETEAIVARINARFGTPGHAPVAYTYGSVDASTLVALYRAADVMLVTPLRDGMNLVAKEFVASRVDDDGVLVLSEHAGAAAELRAALRVDPYDVSALTAACRIALEMTPAERRVRMRRLRIAVRSNDVFGWAQRFLAALGTA
jgi:trehalose 6-phosphate synthase/phosphatase